MAITDSWTRERHEAKREWQRGVRYVNSRIVPAVRTSLAHLLRSSGQELAHLADTLDGRGRSGHERSPGWRPVTGRPDPEPETQPECRKDWK